MLLPKLIPTGSSYVRIPISKRAAMRILLETVQRGSRFWTGGVIAAGKALAFADKMATLYGTDRNQGQRAYAKQNGKANTTLLMYPDDDSGDIRYWLLATAGDGLIHEREKLLDAHHSRQLLMWSDQYQLQHVQRPAEHGGGRSWTWSLTESRYAFLEASIRRHAAASGRMPERTDDLDALVAAIMRMPGFYGIRQQQMELLRLGHHIWQRTHDATLAYPWPERVPYLDKRFACYHTPEPLRLDVLVKHLSLRRDRELPSDLLGT
ncbi:MAG: hypothetical protein OEL88_14000 [Sterolibacteriaceae bacterium MAG5]|nr:hypothetical protein [Candidatus Nitricoxidireducens bremensis]